MLIHQDPNEYHLQMNSFISFHQYKNNEAKEGSTTKE